MRPARLSLGALGVAAVVWGAWLLSDDGFTRLRSTALWLAGVVVLHDVVLAPAVVILGVVAARTLPGRHRAVAAVTFLVWGTLTIAVANVLAGVGGKPDMDSLLNRPYITAWLLVTALLLGGGVATAYIRSRQHQSA
jgi:hypothetical protein